MRGGRPDGGDVAGFRSVSMEDMDLRYLRPLIVGREGGVRWNLARKTRVLTVFGTDDVSCLRLMHSHNSQY